VSRDYYNALLKETDEKSDAADDAPAQEKKQFKRRAVEAELRRKTMELDERFAVRAELAPLTLVRLDKPALSIPCDVFRKQACRPHTLYWNPLTSSLEPMRCSKCGTSTFSVAFTDNSVDPACVRCVG
jgi:hypothetical protein